MCAVIETDNNISSVADLQLYALFWREMELALGPFRLEGDTLVVHRTKSVILPDQRICLEASRVCDYGARPAGHPVQPAQRCDGRGAWMLHQVKGIHNNSLDAALFKVNAIHRAHHAQRSIRQKSRKG